ncbi:UvrD-helicase domain-containing protein [Aromatoleum diolicum]|uniref:DNA 3'-5' helicase n=1 Tax=Aromatoleum diolicum TaxID=75796 RepID=A0ABX1QBZ6_9RHOO|nr:ATP-dependent helicase [Aromatoleum diolicum]NMG75919.1 AAA family ATPase [Aromatoleum diolicum]
MTKTSSRNALATPRFHPSGFTPTAEQCEIQTNSARYVIAMANAGAAKTTTLALRIAESIRRGVSPDHIVALSFSSEAACVLKERLVEVGLEDKLARRVMCSTFDEFCRQVLREHEGYDTPYLPTFEEVAPHVRKAVAEVQRLNAERHTPRELWLPEHNAQIADFLKATRQLKAQRVLPELDEDETVASRAEALDVPEGLFVLYQHMEKSRAGDGDGCAWRTVLDATFDLAVLLAQGELPARLSAYRVVIVDELQDMNPASLACLEHLIEHGRAWFTGAGDFDQVIHRWAGADASFVRTRLGSGWPGLRRLPLTTTFRHGPAMALATSFLKDKPVVSGRSHDALLRLQRYTDPRDEATKLVAGLLDWQRRRKRLDACAIILRAPHQSIAIENALLEAGIGWRVDGLESYLLRSEILMLRGVIAFALEDYESIPGVDKRFQVLQALELWQELSWGTRRLDDLKTAAAQPDLFDAFLKGRLLRPQTRADKAAAELSGEAEMQEAHRQLDLIARLRREGRHDEANAVLRQQHDDAQTIDESPAQRQARMRLEKALTELRAAPPDEPAHLALLRAATILDLKGVAHRLFIDPNTAVAVAKSVGGFIDAARRINQPLREFAQWLRQAEEKSAELRKRKTVLLCTVEAAKGHEFDAVMLPGLEDGNFPLAGWDRTEESNRFYVAITRVRDELTLFVPEASASVSPFVTAMHIDKAIVRGRSQLDALLTGHEPAGF